MTRPKTVALYARVSSQKQADENTIDSQLAALRRRVLDDQFQHQPEMEFCDNGYSGSDLLRPALERLRDLLATSTIDRLYVHSPDRLSRKMAHQAILMEEFRRFECEVVFLNHGGPNDTPEANLLIQMQGMIAEYEREKILERTRRGRKHAATQGSVSVFGGAPYGYRYISKSRGDGVARWEVDPVQSEHVRWMYQWVGAEGCSLAEVVRRLFSRDIATVSGKSRWDTATIRGILLNPAYHGHAIYGKMRFVPRKPAKRPKRGDPAIPRRSKVTTATEPSEQIVISVPAIVDQDLFERVRKRMDENRKRQREHLSGARYLLSGLMICGECGSAYCSRSSPSGLYAYYRCIGTEKYRHGSVICDNTSVKSLEVESLVWSEVCKLLREPERLKFELQRRSDESGMTGEQLATLEKAVRDLRSRLDRLIDAYASGLLQQDEFETRIGPLRERHDRESAALASLRGDASNDLDIESASNALSCLADSVGAGLEEADWSLKRDLMKLLITRIEIHRTEIRLVYKVPPTPALKKTEHPGFLQHWLSRANVAPGIQSGSQNQTCFTSLASIRVN